MTDNDGFVYMVQAGFIERKLRHLSPKCPSRRELAIQTAKLDRMALDYMNASHKAHRARFAAILGGTTTKRLNKRTGELAKRLAQQGKKVFALYRQTVEEDHDIDPAVPDIGKSRKEIRAGILEMTRLMEERIHALARSYRGIVSKEEEKPGTSR